MLRKHEGEQKSANSVKHGGGDDFPNDANLEGTSVEKYEPTMKCIPYIRMKMYMSAK